jgi:hypothetical protein
VIAGQGRANWHYRKAASLKALHRRLLDEDADPATNSQIKQEWTAIDRAMDKEWEENFGLEPSLMPGLGRTPPQSN